MKNLLVIIFTALSFASQSLAGTIFDTVTTEADGTKSTGTISAQDGNLRIEMNHGSDDGTMIYKKDLQGMIVVNHAEENYMVIDKAMVDDVSSQMDALKKQMEETLKSVPPEQRAMVEKMMSGQMPILGKERQSVEVVELGDGGKVNGVSTKQYQVNHGGKAKQRLWIADWSELDGSEDLRDGIFSMVELMSSFLDAMPMIAANMENPFEALAEIDGYPVRTEQLDAQGRVESTTDLVSSKNQSLGSEVFDVPTGYAKQEIPSFNQ